MSDAHQQLDSPSAVPAEPATDEEMLFAKRLMYAIKAALAHSQGSMPFRANYPTQADVDWCDEVCKAVRDNRARPTHPDSNIEEALQNALAT